MARSVSFSGSITSRPRVEHVEAMRTRGGWATCTSGTVNGIIYGMKSTIDHAGRLVIPSPIRREAGLTPGMSLTVRCRDGVVEIEPEPVPVKLVRRGRLLVALPAGRVPTLHESVVERTRRSLREERGGRG